MKTDLNNKNVQKLITDLEKEGISFSFDTDTTSTYKWKKHGERKLLDNVVFERDGKKIKIYYDLFFRITGLCKIFKENEKDNTFEWITVTDEMFYEAQRQFILYRFNLK